MTQVALRAYNHEVESMIEQGRRLDEAVAHCRHILATYPKHLATYRLLGKSYLEAKRYDQAVDIFQRVLVATPDDFVSHVGMSIIADDQGKLDDAIWHMERAFEVQPSNAAIQAELQRLFGRRDGVEPPKIRLTRGALAHMYVQGELYTQAISEIRAVLEGDPERMDMKVLLARAYLRNGQKAEAADICSALLAVSPYCLEANRLMAEMLPGTQASEAGQEHRRRVLDLDPYAEHAVGSIFASDAVPDGAVTLQRLEYTGQGSSEAAGVAVGFRESAQAPVSGGILPNWLSSGAAASATAEVPNEPEPVEDLPEFLRGSGWRPASTAGADGPAAVSAETEADAESADDVVAGELPEWVRALAPNDELEPSAPLSGSTADVHADADWQPLGAAGADAGNAAGAGAKDDTPDWLRELAQGAEPSPVPRSVPPVGNANVQKEQTGSEPAAPIRTDDGLGWLEGLAEKHGANPEELITPKEARPENPPDWIADLGQDESTAPEGWKPIEEGLLQSEATGLSALTPPAISSTPEGQTTPMATSSAAAGTSMDWLSELASSDAFDGMQAPVENDQAPFSGTETPWLQATAASDDSLPEWLADKPAESPAAPIEVAREPSGEQESTVDLPAWLENLDGATEPAASEDVVPKVPQWLQPTTGAAAAAHGTPPPQSPSLAAVGARTPAAMPAESVSKRDPAPVQHKPGLPGKEAVPARTRIAAPLAASDSASLGAAKTELARGNIAAALEMYGRLIRKGKSLTDIIRELREALYRYPVEVPIWQSLGDAYMRANRLQEALDAYTKAEELLR